MSRTARNSGVYLRRVVNWVQSGELGIDESKVIIERRQGQFFGVGDALG